jgi:heme/copper-type cytochrome/quinol oxidase subunit 4
MAIYLKFKSTPYRINKTNNLGKKLDYVDRLKLENSFYYIIDESFNGKLYISSVLFLIFAFTLNIFSLSYFLFSLNRYNQEISQTIMHQITVSIVIILVLISMYIIQTLAYTFKQDRKGLKAYNKYSNKN